MKNNDYTTIVSPIRKLRFAMAVMLLLVLIGMVGFMMLEEKKGITKTLSTVSYKSSPLLPNVKPVSELLSLTPEQDKVLKIYAAAFKTGRVVLGPPGMDPDKVKYLRVKLKELFDSKGYQALAKKVFGYWEDPVMGDDLVKLIADVAATPKADVDLMNELGKKYIK